MLSSGPLDIVGVVRFDPVELEGSSSGTSGAEACRHEKAGRKTAGSESGLLNPVCRRGIPQERQIMMRARYHQQFLLALPAVFNIVADYWRFS